MEADFRENIVVGNGIMAKQLMFELSKKYSDITCIFDNKFAPACSDSSTAINCLRGTQPGVSELGDTIRSSYESFVEFYNKYLPAGVSKSLEIQTWIENGQSHAKWLRRYQSYSLSRDQKFNLYKAHKEMCTVETEAYFISTKIFFDWYEKKLESIQFERGFVSNIEKNSTGYTLSLNTGEKFSCKNLFLCTSYMSESFIELCQKEEYKKRLSRQKKVYGVYLHHKLKVGDYGIDTSHSFCLSYEFIRMVYRKESHDIVISFPDINKNSHIVNKEQLEGSLEEFKKKLNLSLLPTISEFTLKQGIRSKGHQRLPFCEQIDQNLYCCSGLYKNAFSFAYFFSKKIVNDLSTE